MPTWAPLKVKVTRTPAGELVYPDFDQISAIANSSIVVDRPGRPKWPQYFDTYGSGWRFDNRTNVLTGDAESPIGEWVGFVLLEPSIVDEAVTLFPTVCARIPPATFVSWFNTRHRLADKYDVDVLLGLLVKYFFQHVVDPNLLTPLERQRLNRKNPELGIRAREWDDFATERGINLE